MRAEARSLLESFVGSGDAAPRRSQARAAQAPARRAGSLGARGGEAEHFDNPCKTYV